MARQTWAHTAGAGIHFIFLCAADADYWKADQPNWIYQVYTFLARCCTRSVRVYYICRGAYTSGSVQIKIITTPLCALYLCVRARGGGVRRSDCAAAAESRFCFIFPPPAPPAPSLNLFLFILRRLERVWNSTGGIDTATARQQPTAPRHPPENSLFFISAAPMRSIYVCVHDFLYFYL